MLSKGHKRKQQIIDTAKEMFINNGFQSTHIGNVCEVLNIARGTVYQYFKNKREILYAVFDSIEEEIDDILDPEELNEFFKKSNSPRATFKLISDRITASMKPVINEPIAIRLIFRDIRGIDEGVISRVDRFLDKIIKQVTLDIEELIKRGYCKKGVKADITALILIGGVFFVISTFQKRDDPDLNMETVDSIVSNQLKSILKS